LPLEVVLLRRVAKVKNVIHMLDYFIHNEQLVIVLERPEHCCDLYDFISERSNGLDERLARDFFKQIVQILKDIHQCGVSLIDRISSLINHLITSRFFIEISKMKISLSIHVPGNYI
jgi:serine/threonine protein kinase